MRSLTQLGRGEDRQHAEFAELVDQCGVLVFARTWQQLDTVAKLIHRFNSDARAADPAAPLLDINIISDEADMVIGCAHPRAPALPRRRRSL